MFTTAICHHSAPPMLMSSHLAIATSSVSQSRMRVPSFGAVSIGCQSAIFIRLRSDRYPRGHPEHLAHVRPFGEDNSADNDDNRDDCREADSPLL